MTIEVSVDPDLCIGSGECVRILPAGFEIDEAAGVSRPLDGVEASDPELLLRVAYTCPTQSIRLVAADGRVLHETN